MSLITLFKGTPLRGLTFDDFVISAPDDDAPFDQHVAYAAIVGCAAAQGSWGSEIPSLQVLARAYRDKYLT